MAFDNTLVERVRKAIGHRAGLTEKPMFGCHGFFIHGHLACGVHERSLMVRLDEESAAAALKEPGARPFDLSGRPMKGWILVDPDQAGGTEAVRRWIERGVRHASALPPKASRKGKR